MEKGSGTRSGLLWEVERVLDECRELDCLPQVLVMENVPNVCGSANIKPWNEWLDKLHSLGYTSYYRILNAKDFGIPQNRKRCFMVSILGEYAYSFPKKQPLEYVLKDFLEKKVEESYYLSEKWVRYVLGNALNPALKDFYDRGEMSLNKEVAYCLNTKIDRRIGDSNYITDDHKEIKVKDFISSCNEDGEPTLLIPTATSKGYMEAKEGDGVLPNWRNARGTVQQGGCPTIMTSPDTIGVVVKSDRLRIRKLTEGECYRLMGFEEKDTKACREVGQPKSAIYHQAGDSIVTTCLVALFGELFGFDYEQAIKDHADKLHKEVEG